MNCSLKNLHKSLKIRIFGYGSEQRTANSEQRTANSEQRTANSEQRTANSEQRTANSEQRTANKFYNKQPYLSIKKIHFGEIFFSEMDFFMCEKLNGHILA